MSAAHAARLLVPFGVLGLCTAEGFLTGIDFLPAGTPPLAPRDALTARVARQIQTWLADPRHGFDLPLAPRGTFFQRRVWAALQRIPPGTVTTYGELARALGSSPRAVGQACGANPIPIVIPCHRVVARQGVGGFMHHTAGEALAIKEWLLRHERGTA